ncbi:MAG: acyl-CoA dehydrogenase family protein [Nitrospinota bacterium]
MVDMRLTDEQLELQELVREFCLEELKPIAAECDRRAQTDPAGCFPIEVLKAASKLGLRTLALPRAYGGRDIGVLTHSILLEEVMAVEPGFGAVFHQLWRLSQHIAEFGTEEQKKKFLIPFIEDDTCLISIAMTEPGAGTDNTLPYEGVDGGLRLSAEKRGGEWVLNGTKHFIACAALAKIFFVLARTDPKVPVSKGVTQFLLWRDTPGFRVARTHDKLGAALLMNAELVLENVRVPESDVYIGENMGLSRKGRNYGRSIPMVATFGLGIARGAYEEALSCAREEVEGAKPLIKHPAVAMRLADMLTLIEATRSIIWKAAWSADNLETYNPREALIASYMSTVCARRVCDCALQVFGREGYMRDRPVEKFCRDALMCNHINSTVDGRLLRIGRLMAGQPLYVL